MINITLDRFSAPFAPWAPKDGRVFDRFAFDTETADIDDERPYLTPALVIASATDGKRGVFLPRDLILPFFKAHRNSALIAHNAAFDLRVVNEVIKREFDVYALVEEGRVWDTQILHRLHSLAALGHPARGKGESTLARCAKDHLGVVLDKDVTDAAGRKVRTNFGQFLGKSPSVIPPKYLDYAARDPLATWHLFERLNVLIRDALHNARGAFGYVDDRWLRDAIKQFGPLTHHVQLKASILTDVLCANGIGIDRARREEKAQKVAALLAECKERLRKRGLLVGEKGSGKVLQKILTQLARDNPDLELKRTPSGEAWSTKEEDLADLAAEDEFFADYATYKTAEKLHSTYLRKMGRRRLHPKFGFLLQTGRTSCGGGFNLQNLPRENDESKAGATNTIRGCFVPEEGNVFIDSDYSQIELVTLGYAIQRQFGWYSRLAELINEGRDVHRLIASKMLLKEPAAVTKDERASVKPVSFGRPGGMGAKSLVRLAKASYGLTLTEEDVQQRIAAYHQLCPELDAFLQDEADAGLVLATSLNLTPAEYNRVLGQHSYRPRPDAHQPQDWLGLMLLKVLHYEQPLKRNGDPYTPEQIEFLWQAAQPLAQFLKSAEAERLRRKEPHQALFEAVRNWAGRRPVFTVTGRLRANATFCASRNTLFQGAAADGAILGMWLVWRAGYQLVDFVHDQLVVESPADDRVFERVADVERLMKRGMAMVVPGMNVKVETVVTRSLNKADLDPRYAPPETLTPQPAPTEGACAG